jgi:hypothetical protein
MTNDLLLIIFQEFRPAVYHCRDSRDIESDLSRSLQYFAGDPVRRCIPDAVYFVQPVGHIFAQPIEFRSLAYQPVLFFLIQNLTTRLSRFLGILIHSLPVIIFEIVKQ